VAERLSDPSTRAVLAGTAGPHVVTTDGECRPALVPASDLAAAGALDEAVLLGLDATGSAVIAVDAERLPDGLAAENGAAALSLRDVGARLSDADAGLLAYATAIVGWHRSHRFCANCGAATGVGEAGHVRRCPRCGAVHHPRTDPVVIMLVHDVDRVVLGRQPTWADGRYSALAGFVEPGESLEEAVAREVAEEAGVTVDGVLYRSSQPWPFPGSLMAGFHARHAGGEPSASDAELEDVRWFERDELAAAARGEGPFHLPPPIAIARRLIDEWLGSG
jgi:NAD+ diphosphatase